MSRLDYHVVDVFTDHAFAGNPLAVVPEADALSGEQMQRLAREFNLSETTFVLEPTEPSATYRARIFTPAAELPFAGHPSVGTAWLLAQLGRYDAGTVVQECGAGLLPITVTAAGATLTGGTPTQSEPHEESPFLEAVGLDAAAFAGKPVRVCGCGLDWAYLQVHDEAVGSVEIDLGALARLPGSGLCVFSWADGRAHSRCFAAGVGVPEDPATGSAALGLGVHLVASGLLPGEGESAYEIRQGAEIGRPSLLSGAVHAESGRAVQVQVTGGVARVATGQIAVPG